MPDPAPADLGAVYVRNPLIAAGAALSFMLASALGGVVVAQDPGMGPARTADGPTCARDDVFCLWSNKSDRRLCAPTDVPCIFRHQHDGMPHQPLAVELMHSFECSPAGHPSDRAWVRWRAAPNDPGPLTHVEIADMGWNGRAPTAAELEAVNTAVRPYATPRSASAYCGPDGILVTLAMWEERDGSNRVAILMDAEGFRLVRPVGPVDRE